jgi:hypothetical protein
MMDRPEAVPPPIPPPIRPSTPRYSRCPKCTHAPLPDDQSLPAACPACGLVLAKYGVAPVRQTRDNDDAPNTAPSATEGFVAHLQSVVELVRHVPERVDPIHFWARVALLGAFAFWGLVLIGMDYRTGEIGASFLHRPLLIFHEAGHVVFIPFGRFMTFLGGTLGQLIMPAVLMLALLIKNRDPFGASIGLWFLGVSLLDVAPYAYDALQPQLMLLGGRTGEDGGHDWIYLLTQTGLLSRAHAIGWWFHKMGSVVVLLSCYWGAWILWQQRRRLVSVETLEGE